jgi:hypothetical protein
VAETAALLMGDVLPDVSMRHWVLSFPYPLRILFAVRPTIMRQMLGIVYRRLGMPLIKKAGADLGGWRAAGGD